MMLELDLILIEAPVDPNIEFCKPGAEAFYAALRYPCLSFTVRNVILDLKIFSSNFTILLIFVA